MVRIFVKVSETYDMTLQSELNELVQKNKSISEQEKEYAQFLNEVLSGAKNVTATKAVSTVDGIIKLYESKELSVEFEKLLTQNFSAESEDLHNFLKKFIEFAFPCDTLSFDEMKNIISNAHIINAFSEGIRVNFKYSTPVNVWDLINIVYRYVNEASAIRKAHYQMQNSELPSLTPRETQVLTYLGKGFTIKEIAEYMGIKWFTVNDHIKVIYKKLNVSSRAEAAVLASKNGLI